MSRRAALAVVAALLAHPLIAQARSELDVRRGKSLFDRSWARGATAAAVGPLYDATSCAACHPSGGRGTIDGPGLVVRLADDPDFGRQLQRHAIAGVPAEPATEIHWVPAQLGGVDLPLRRPIVDVRGGVPATLRLAPSLRGVTALGRVRPGASGRFGWKADVTSIDDQVASALAIDLGLSSARRQAAGGDCTEHQRICMAAIRPRLEVPARDVDAIVAYLDALRPRPLPGFGEAGRALFDTSGCAACHQPSIEVAADPALIGTTRETLRTYTDLRLHDLGPELADPPGFPERSRWRTAPLVDLAAADGLLHDGRARDPREAIVWHAGEAAAARGAFLALGASRQSELLRFLNGL